MLTVIFGTPGDIRIECLFFDTYFRVLDASLVIRDIHPAHGFVVIYCRSDRGCRAEFEGENERLTAIGIYPVGYSRVWGLMGVVRSLSD